MPEEGHAIVWNVITHVHRERTNDWYWGLGVTTMVGAAVSIWLGNALFALILVLGVGSLAALMIRGPREHTVRIDVRGVSIDGTLYPYRSLQSFWVEPEHERESPRLLLTTTGIITPHIAIPLEDHEQAAQVRTYLRNVVEEVEQHPHMGEHLAEMLGL